MDRPRTQRRGFRARAWLTAMVLLGVFALAAEAEASSLLVKGPPGAVVLLDGVPRGTLPLESPIDLAPGEYEFRCEMPGYITHQEVIQIRDPGHELSLTLRLVQRKRRTAVLYSLLLAGLGQHYQGNHSRGWTLMGIQLAAIVGAIYGEGQFKDHRSDYDDASRLYQDAVDADDIAQHRKDASATYFKMESAERLRNSALFVAGATAVFAAVEAWIAHPKLVVSTSTPEPASQATLDLNLQVGWRTQF